MAHGKGRLIHSDGDVYDGDWFKKNFELHLNLFFIYY